jgi:hypothetical protein
MRKYVVYFRIKKVVRAGSMKEAVQVAREHLYRNGVGRITWDGTDEIPEHKEKKK